MARMTCEGYVRKVKSSIGKFGSCVVMQTADGKLHFIPADKVPKIIHTYGKSEHPDFEDWLFDDALDLGMA